MYLHFHQRLDKQDHKTHQDYCKTRTWSEGRVTRTYKGVDDGKYRKETRSKCVHSNKIDGRLTDSTSWKLGICEDIDILNFFVIVGLTERTYLEHNVPYRRCVEFLFDDFPTLLKCCEVIEQKLGTRLARSASIICQHCKYALH